MKEWCTAQVHGPAPGLAAEVAWSPGTVDVQVARLSALRAVVSTVETQQASTGPRSQPPHLKACLIGEPVASRPGGGSRS